MRWKSFYLIPAVYCMCKWITCVTESTSTCHHIVERDVKLFYDRILQQIKKNFNRKSMQVDTQIYQLCYEVTFWNNILCEERYFLIYIDISFLVQDISRYSCTADYTTERSLQVLFCRVVSCLSLRFSLYTQSCFQFRCSGELEYLTSYLLVTILHCRKFLHRKRHCRYLFFDTIVNWHIFIYILRFMCRNKLFLPQVQF